MTGPGQVYSGLNRFVDDCDAGNGWFHDEPVNNELRLTDTVCTIRRIASGPVCVTFAIHQTLKLPKSRLDQEEAALTFKTSVTLWAGKPYADIHAAIENPATDHRLRVLFPTGSTSGRYTASPDFSFHGSRGRSGRRQAVLG